MKEFRDRNVPVYFIKYEDLIDNYQETMLLVSKFLLNSKTIEGTVIEERVMLSKLQVNPTLRTYRGIEVLSEEQ